MAWQTYAFRRWGYTLGAGVLLGCGFWLGQQTLDPLAAQQIKPASATVPTTTATTQTDGSNRAIAYVFGNVPITREEFGDYFISLYGAERLELFVNRRIIEMVAAKRGVEVTPQEIDAQIEEDCKRIGVQKADFVKTVLKTRYGKTLDEWRMDVLRPRLLLSKLCRDRITVGEDELRQVYENRYGKKVRCKIIIWPKDEYHIAVKQYAELRKGDKEFDAIATKQKDSALAARAGEVEPIGRYSGKHSAKIEEVAFNLEVGQVSSIIELPIGFMVIKCLGHVEPVKGVEYTSVRADLTREVVERKLEEEIPKYFAEIKKESKTILLMPRAKLSEDEIQQATGVSPKGTGPIDTPKPMTETPKP